MKWDKQGKIGRFTFRTRMRQKDEVWGHFGGGWHWKVGFQLGGHTLLLSLLVFTVTVVYER